MTRKIQQTLFKHMVSFARNPGKLLNNALIVSKHCNYIWIVLDFCPAPCPVSKKQSHIASVFFLIPAPSMPQYSSNSVAPLSTFPQL